MGIGGSSPKRGSIRYFWGYRIMSEIDLTLLENHIDEPIKKCVVGLALLGFVPCMSCCGFDYKGEKTKKKHILDKPYIYLDYTKLNSSLKSTLIDLAQAADWAISSAGRFLDFYGRTPRNDFASNWKDSDSPHRHEISNLAIGRLQKALEDRKISFAQIAEITDGNHIYKEDFKLKYWQYEPTKSWLVTPQTFEKF